MFKKNKKIKGQNNNPIYVDYYSHMECDCYKIDLPFSMYKRHTLVLCEVSKGLPYAIRLARKALKKHINNALEEDLNYID